jgi:hypothetical protein
MPESKKGTAEFQLKTLMCVFYIFFLIFCTYKQATSKCAKWRIPEMREDFLRFLMHLLRSSGIPKNFTAKPAQL